MAATRRLKELVSAATAKLDLPDGPATVALSGGADSGALAYLAAEMGMDLRAIHVDHQLGGSPVLAKAAAEVASRLGVGFDVETVAVEEGPSIEEKAREARYAVLERVPGPVITGHTRDDSVETILINMIRGSGPAGLAGIPRFRPPNIYRPMLEVTRSETREIATLADLPFQDDPMNQDISLTRNRVRLNLVPMMRELNPEVDAALARAGEYVGRDSDFLDQLADQVYRLPLPVSVVLTVPRVLADRMLRRALEESGVGPTADRIERMWSVAAGVSDRQDLAGGRSVTRRGALLVIE